MNLTVAQLIKIGFEEVLNSPQKTFKRRSDGVILYEYQEPMWFVQLDDIISDFTNLMRVQTEEDLEKALLGRNIK